MPFVYYPFIEPLYYNSLTTSSLWTEEFSENAHLIMWDCLFVQTQISYYIIFLAICIGLFLSSIDFISQLTRFIIILLYNCCKIFDNKMVMIFTWRSFHVKHFYRYNQSLDTLFHCIIRLLYCFSSCKHVDLYVCGCHDFVRSLIFMEGRYK